MFHLYQVTFDASGELESAIKLPDVAVPQKRIIFVSEATKAKAIKAAEKFYPLVKG